MPQPAAQQVDRLHQLNLVAFRERLQRRYLGASAETLSQEKTRLTCAISQAHRDLDTQRLSLSALQQRQRQRCLDSLQVELNVIVEVMKA